MVKTKHHEAIPMAGSFNKSIPSLKPSKSSFASLNHSQLNQLGQLNQVSQTTAAQAAAAQAAQNSRLSSLMDLPAASSLYGQTLPPYTKGLICNIGDSDVGDIIDYDLAWLVFKYIKKLVTKIPNRASTSVTNIDVIEIVSILVLFLEFYKSDFIIKMSIILQRH